LMKFVRPMKWLGRPDEGVDIEKYSAMQKG
jgi:hypothetical protein